MKKLIYTFFNYNKKTSCALYDSSAIGWDKKYINGRSLNPLLKSIAEYNIILGIADHNKNAKQIRFDPRYVNKYGRSILIDGAREEYLSNLEFIPPEDSYTFSSSTNGPCNRSAYMIMSEIERMGLDTQFAFFHIPKWITGELLDEFLAHLLIN